jgi:hypothetical protein
MRLMEEGNKVRHTAATMMNDQSSRSHAVFTLFVTQAHYFDATKTTGEKVGARLSGLCLALALALVFWLVSHGSALSSRFNVSFHPA